ncbi:HAD family hydrolase [Candidatus Albibeggiatoa sp. nov. BB20]|uniref:HAD family hydrolase n=1 Tax=Candidatus Albibeggiatoa sp. nov. BB20 TaxID=3162723 RepID=UPI0033656C3A
MNQPFYVYVDVDETFVRNYGVKRIPIPTVIEHIKALKDQGALMYCWSSGGAEYAQSSAKEFGIKDCFLGFLPKPELIIDDVDLSHWRNLLQIHPNQCHGHTIESYRKQLIK